MVTVLRQQTRPAIWFWQRCILVALIRYLVLVVPSHWCISYGTQSVPRVDKIVGPGGAHVATAKKQVFGQVGIDMIAGPSEVLILADGSTPVDWAVMDLFSQAEHDLGSKHLDQ